MESNINMFTPAMKNGIFRQLDGRTVVTMDHGAAILLYLQVIQNAPKPDTLTGTRGSCYILCFSS
jgi:hypothetical protein